MTFLFTAFHILYILIVSILFLNVFYVFILAVAGKFFFKKKVIIVDNITPENKIAVLIPAYKEDLVIMSTASQILKQNYPSESFDVYIIADSFKMETLSILQGLPLTVFDVSFQKSTKTKSLNEAFRRIKKKYDIAIICDADNIMGKDFLRKVNSSFNSGADAIQGKRVAKNLDSSFAILDACSEGINNNLFRKGANALGLSSSVIGSGMAFRYLQIEEILSSIDAIGGFDKVMQLHLVEKGVIIEYLDDAIIYDEKVDSVSVFKQQRKRWVSSQFIYLKKYFLKSFAMLAKGNFSYFNLAILNNLALPRSFLLILLPLFTVISYFIFHEYFLLISIATVIYAISLLLAIPKELINTKLLIAIISLPSAILAMFATLLHLNKANKEFIHTVHTKTDISNENYFDRNDNPALSDEKKIK